MQQFSNKLAILLFGVSCFFFTGCKKEISSNTSANNPEAAHANPTPESSSQKAVHIRATFSQDQFSNVYGTFRTWGALGDDVYGDATMDTGGMTPKDNVAHCIVVLTFYDYEHNVRGTITIRQDFEFAKNKGQWHIVGGTGDFTGIKGNGASTMSSLFDQDMTGV